MKMPICSYAIFFLQQKSLLAICLLACAIGCNSDSVDGKYEVSGDITLDGQPLKTGTITFMHEQKQERPAATMFKEGSYSIPAEKGLKPGKYIVSIRSEVAQSGGTPASNSSNPMLDGNIKPAKQIIPAKYNAKSTLTVEVTSAGSNEFDFPITTK